MFDDEGCTNIRHYIQSGNVVFEASAALAKKIPERIERAILKQAKLTVPVVVRSQEEIASVVKGNPYLEKAKGNEIALHVAFLADTPDKKAVAALDPNRSPGDELVVKGKDIYLFCPNGIGRSKLTTGWFDSKLATTSTLRNWRTVITLEKMMGE